MLIQDISVKILSDQSQEVIMSSRFDKDEEKSCHGLYCNDIQWTKVHVLPYDIRLQKLRASVIS